MSQAEMSVNSSEIKNHEMAKNLKALQHERAGLNMMLQDHINKEIAMRGYISQLETQVRELQHDLTKEIAKNGSHNEAAVPLEKA